MKQFVSRVAALDPGDEDRLMSLLVDRISYLSDVLSDLQAAGEAQRTGTEELATEVALVDATAEDGDPERLADRYADAAARAAQLDADLDRLADFHEAIGAELGLYRTVLNGLQTGSMTVERAKRRILAHASEHATVVRTDGSRPDGDSTTDE